MKEKMTYALFLLLLTIGLIGAGNAEQSAGRKPAQPDVSAEETLMNDSSGVTAEQLAFVQPTENTGSDAEGEEQKSISETETEANFVPNQVDLYFPSNPTTGYAWFAEAADPTVIGIRDLYFEDSSELGFTGPGGTHWFHLSGLQPGTTSVSFRYVRPWEPDKAVQNTVNRMSVDDRLNVLIWGVEVG